MINKVLFSVGVNMKKMVRRFMQPFSMLFFLISFLSIFAGCAFPIQPQATSHGLPSQSPIIISSPTKNGCLEGDTDFTNQIHNVLQNPQYFIGKTVTLTGYYRGWDLLKEAQGTSPITRSDWVLRDRCGAIYVLARDGMNLGLNPGDINNTVRVVSMVGIVRMAASGQPYIEPQDMKLLR